MLRIYFSYGLRHLGSRRDVRGTGTFAFSTFVFPVCFIVKLFSIFLLDFYAALLFSMNSFASLYAVVLASFFTFSIRLFLAPSIDVYIHYEATVISLFL